MLYLQDICSKHIYIYILCIYLVFTYLYCIHPLRKPYFPIPLFDLSHQLFPKTHHPGEDSLGLGTVSTSVSASGWRLKFLGFSERFWQRNHSIPGFPWDETGTNLPGTMKKKHIPYTEVRLKIFCFPVWWDMYGYLSCLEGTYMYHKD